MERMLFYFLLMPLVGIAQSNKRITSFEKSIPVTLGKRIHLPEPDYNIDAIAEPNSVQRIILIREDSVYRKIFSQYVNKNDTLPEIDFKESELVLYSACGICLAGCELTSGHQSCHRPACNYQYAWFVREKENTQRVVSDEEKVILDVLYNQKPALSSSRATFPLLKHTALDKHFEMGSQSCYLYKINTDSVYDAVFDGHIKQMPASIPEINFKNKVLLVQVSCHQCLIAYIIDQKLWINKPPHAGHCVYSARWFIADKQ
jgi:hypothetical protein